MNDTHSLDLVKNKENVNMINKVKEIVTAGGKIALNWFGRVESERKSDNSMVTRADIEVGELLTEQLSRYFPGYAVVNEESARSHGERVFKEKEYVWVIDPIDGTNSYKTRMPIWAISMGLMRNEKAIMGMIYMPVMGEYYYTHEGMPAIFESERWGRIKMNISQQDEPIDSQSLLVVTSTVINRLNLNFPGKARAMGSCCADFCYVSRGDAMGCIIKGHLWDLVAGITILEKAGGIARYIDRSPLVYSDMYNGQRARDYIVCGSEYAVNYLLERVKNK